MLNILFEDTDIIIFEKRAGIHSTTPPTSKERSLADEIVAEFPALKDISPNSGDGPLVQRLDKDTSGVIVGAKSRAIWEKLHALLTDHKCTKVYHALCEGRVIPVSSLTVWIGTPYRRAKKVRVYTEKPSAKHRAQQALVSIKLLQYDPTKNFSTVEISTITGCRHQVRAILAHQKNPLIGDTLYGSTRTLEEIGNQSKGRSFFLHASSITFSHPRTKDKITISIPDPSKK